MATRVRLDDQAVPSPMVPGLVVLAGILVLASIVGLPVFNYGFCQINVPTGYITVLTRKTGKDIPNDAELAPDASYKGLQKDVLAEGRHFHDPWTWDCPACGPVPRRLRVVLPQSSQTKGDAPQGAAGGYSAPALLRWRRDAVDRPQGDQAHAAADESTAGSQTGNQARQSRGCAGAMMGPRVQANASRWYSALRSSSSRSKSACAKSPSGLAEKPNRLKRP